MSYESRLLAGILLIVLPTVMIGGVSILSLLIGDPAYMENPLRQDLWRAGHAHAGVWLILALVALRYVDEANLSNGMKWLVRGSIPIAALLVPSAFFLSVLSPDATVPNGLIYLAHVGAVLLAGGVLVLSVWPRQASGTKTLSRVAIAGQQMQVDVNAFKRCRRLQQLRERALRG
jgi:hypothetical protein